MGNCPEKGCDGTMKMLSVYSSPSLFVATFACDKCGRSDEARTCTPIITRYVWRGIEVALEAADIDDKNIEDDIKDILK